MSDSNFRWIVLICGHVIFIAGCAQINAIGGGMMVSGLIWMATAAIIWKQ